MYMYMLFVNPLKFFVGRKSNDDIHVHDVQIYILFNRRESETFYFELFFSLSTIEGNFIIFRSPNVYKWNFYLYVSNTYSDYLRKITYTGLMLGSKWQNRERKKQRNFR